MVILVMGVSGSGKTTVGRHLAADLGWAFADADDFHSAENIAKMASGQPLTDADRVPWLAALRHFIDQCLADDRHAVLACSALKQSYRASLVPDRARVKIVFLHGSRELLLSRLQNRQGHYMRAEMLESQLGALEPPRDALSLDVAAPPAELVARIRQAFSI